MNHIFRYTIIALLPYFLWSCESSDAFDYFLSKSYIEVDEVASILGEESSSATFNVKANCAWTVSEKPSWLNVTPVTGNGNAQVTLTSNSDNEPEAERTGNIVITADNGAIRQTVTVTQGRGPERISFVDNIDFRCIASSETHMLTCRGSWTISAVSWINVSPTSGTGDTEITVSVGENRDTKARTGEITIKASGKEFKTNVTQDEYVLSFNVTSESFVGDTKEIKIPKNGGEYTLMIESSDGWTSENVPQWLTLSKTGSSNGEVTQITVTAEPNTGSERTANVFFKNTVDNNYNTTVKFSQEAADNYLNAIPEGLSSIEFDVEGGTKIITVESTSAVMVNGVGDDLWISCTKNEAAGSNKYNLTFVAKPNRQASVNTATIIISNETKAKDLVITATQAAFVPELSIPNATVNVGSKRNTDPILVRVESNAAWSVSSNQSWCTAQRTDDGNYVSITVDSNPTDEEREAELTVRLTDYSMRTATIRVVQESGGAIPNPDDNNPPQTP